MQIDDRLFAIMAVLFGLGGYANLMPAVKAGRRVGAPLWIIVVSPMAIAYVWMACQHMQPNSFGWRNISYAAVLGDAIVLPLLLSFAAWGWERIGGVFNDTRYVGWKWNVGCYTIGLIAGIGFHLSGGPTNGNSPDLDVRLHSSPTSLAHNLGIIPAIGGTVLNVVVPLMDNWLRPKVTNLTAVGRASEANIPPTVPTRIVVLMACMLAVYGGLLVVDQVRTGLPVSSSWYLSLHWLDADVRWPLHLW